MDKILELAKKIKSCYGDNAVVYVTGTINKLCDKGIAKSCFEDYTVLVDVITVLDTFRIMVANA